MLSWTRTEKSAPKQMSKCIEEMENTSENIHEKLQKNGYVVLENFLSPEEVEELKNCGENFTTNLPEENERKIFDAAGAQQSKERYFLESALKISHFFEAEALESDGKLKVHPRVALNKVGHALHWLNPIFKKHTFDDKIKDVCLELMFEEPAVCQSMYIYKNPGTGSAVTPHQDASYLYTDPIKLLGFWIALDRSTCENGCLWIAPQSHQSGVHRRYIRNNDANSEQLLIYDSPEPTYSSSTFRPVPVSKGACILLHGQVVHFSNSNKSDQSRHAYTFHVIETKHTHYAKNNWLQPPKEGFPRLYKN